MLHWLANNPIIALARITWRFSEGRHSNVVLYGTLFFIANLLSLLQPIIVAHVLNVIQEQGIHTENLFSVLGYLALLPLLDLVFWCFHGPARVLERKNAFLVRRKYKQYLLAGTMALPMDWHADHHSGDTIDKIEKGTRALYDFTEHSFQVIEALVRFVGSFIALAFFNLNATLVVVLLVFVAIRTILAFDKKLILQYRELNRAENRISAKVFDTLSNISTVIILRVAKLLERDIVQAMRRPFTLFHKNSKLNEWKWFSASFGAGLLQFFVLGAYVSMAIGSGETILVGTIFALFSYTNRINDVFFTFAYLYNDIVRERTAVENAEEIARHFTTYELTGGTLDHSWQRCEVRRLSFSYTDQQARMHLEDVSLEWRRGEKIALIGESGSGKTTLLKLIRALYTLSRGEVAIDGVVLPRGFESMSEDVALIPQDPEIFESTLRENITMGVDRSAAEMERFVGMARLRTVVERLPRGLESSVVEKGVNLSGGERQRLALARGLMAAEDKSILLLDESTSSVDPLNEMAIYENIFTSYKDKTVIASIHRLHLLRLFDTIYMFQKGKIVARGDFITLLETSEVFADQWEKYIQSHKDWQRPS